MPTFNQLVRKGREQATYKSNSPAMQYSLNTLKNEERLQLQVLSLLQEKRRMHCPGLPCAGYPAFLRSCFCRRCRESRIQRCPKYSIPKTPVRNIPPKG